MTTPTKERVEERAIVVFARAPQLGRVKTRLAATMGDARARSIYMELGEHAVKVALAAYPGAVVVHYTPADQADQLRAWLGAGVELREQCDGDLGCRMAAAIGETIAAGAGRVAVVGTDCPGLSAGAIHTAFAALDHADVAIGPTHDGGYYVIALRASQPALFANIPWSSSETLSATLRAAKDAGLCVTVLEPLLDIDTDDDWAAWTESRGVTR